MSEGANRSPNRTFPEMSYEDLIAQGNFHYGSKNYEQSLDYYSRALSKNPTIATYFRKRTRAFLNRFVESAADCSRALEPDPTHVNAHYLLGLELCRIKRFEEGLSHITRAINLNKITGIINRKRIKTAMFRNRKLRREAIKEEKAKKVKKAEIEAKKARKIKKWINVKKAMEEKAKRLRRLRSFLNRLVAKKREQLFKEMKTAVSLHLDDRERIKLEARFHHDMMKLNAIFTKLEKKYKGVCVSSTVGSPLKLE